MRIPYRFGGIGLLLLLLAFSSSAHSNDTRPLLTDKDQLVLGLLPFVSPERLARRFEPLALYLSGKLGVDVRLETAPNYEEFVRRTAEKSRYDILFTASHFYYTAQQNSGYRAAVRVSGEPVHAIIVVPKSSPIVTLNDLRGRRLATPNSQALATLLVRERLAIIPGDVATEITLFETPTHNASLLSTLNGLTDAASLMSPVFQRFAPEIKEQFRVIATTRSVPHLPFSVAPWIMADRAEAFTKAMLEIGSTQEDRALLQHLGWPGFVAVEPGEYDVFSSFATKHKFE